MTIARGLYDLDSLVKLIDENIPRLISQIDRDPDSPTYGSADRGYWMYRLHDFDSGVVQQSVLALAALSQLSRKVDLSSTTYLKTIPSEYWAMLAKAANRRNLKLMDRTGFVDEYYPGEQSFPATVFISYAVLKAALILNQEEIIQHIALQYLADKLLQRKASPAANQDTAAAAFLALYSNTRKWKAEQTKATLTELLERPDQGGEFWEYGGLDVGYSTVSLNYLAYILADQSGPEFVRQKVIELAGLISHFITPSGNLGGEYAARSTTYFLPFGFLTAAGLDRKLAGKFEHLDIVSAYQRLDDRYLIHYCLPSLILSALHLAENGTPETSQISLPNEWENQYFSEFDVFRAAKQRTKLFVGMNKGGTYQIELDGETTIDAGYRVTRGGKTYATCVLVPEPEVTHKIEKDIVQLNVKAPFLRYGALTASPLKMIILRVLGFLGPRLNKIFKQILIQKPQSLSEVYLDRSINLDKNTNLLTIEDQFVGLQKDDILKPAPPSSFRLVPSAKFYQPGEAPAAMSAENVILDNSKDKIIHQISLID